MSTSDVPGYNPANRDQLAAGCWAESPDGTLIRVEDTEQNRVIFSVFDLSKTPPVVFRTAMVTRAFQEKFSFNVQKGRRWFRKKDEDPDVRWTWHDKTPFPWDRVIKEGVPEGVGYVTASQQISDAQRVLNSMREMGMTPDQAPHPVDPSDFQHFIDQVVKHPAARDIMRGIQSAVDKLRPGAPPSPPSDGI